MNKRRVLLVLIALLLPILGLQAQPGDLESILARHLVRFGTDKATVSVEIRRKGAESALFARQPARRMILASNTKLFTSAAFLMQVGADGVHSTELLASGTVTDGVLSGSLILRSDGDPNVSGRLYDGNPTHVYRKLAAQLKAKGVKQVNGDVVVDDLAFDRVWRHSDWGAGSRLEWWGAPVAAVSLNDNCIDVFLTPSAAGKPVNVTLRPKTKYISLTNSCRSTKDQAAHAISFIRPERTNQLEVRGRYWTRKAVQEESVPVYHPPLFAGTVLKEVLVDEGVVVTGTVRLAQERDSKARRLARFTSSILESLRICNQRSQNYYAEMLLKSLGHRVKGKGSWANGIAAARELLTKAGVENLVMADGSGLSRGNKGTAEEIVRLLDHMSRRDDWTMYYESLAGAGESEGSLRRRMKELPLTVRGKTGTISGVSTLSGAVLDPEGKPVFFSVLVNDIKGSSRGARDLQDAIVTSLAEWLEAGGQ